MIGAVEIADAVRNVVRLAYVCPHYCTLRASDRPRQTVLCLALRNYIGELVYVPQYSEE